MKGTAGVSQPTSELSLAGARSPPAGPSPQRRRNAHFEAKSSGVSLRELLQLDILYVYMGTVRLCFRNATLVVSLDKRMRVLGVRLALRISGRVSIKTRLCPRCEPQMQG